jgi:hypothetical protein
VNLLGFISEFPTNADVAGWWLRARSIQAMTTTSVRGRWQPGYAGE